MTTEEIKQRITDLRALAASLRAQADERDKLADGYQREIDALLLAAYWNEHPELTPIAVGDEIIIDKRHVGQLYKVTIARIDLSKQAVDVDCWINQHTKKPIRYINMGLREVCEERCAFLEQQQQAT